LKKGQDTVYEVIAKSLPSIFKRNQMGSKTENKTASEKCG